MGKITNFNAFNQRSRSLEKSNLEGQNLITETMRSWKSRSLPKLLNADTEFSTNENGLQDTKKYCISYPVLTNETLENHALLVLKHNLTHYENREFSFLLPRKKWNVAHLYTFRVKLVPTILLYMTSYDILCYHIISRFYFADG